MTTHTALNGLGLDDWRRQTRVVLQPIAAPSILGLYAFSAATMMVAANLAGWYGDAGSPEFLFPFAAIFGGLAQLLAGMWSFRARDALATAMHGMWGSFWLAYGLLWLLVAAGATTLPTGAFPELAFWFVMLAAITWIGAIAAAGENLGLFLTLVTLAGGSSCLAIHYFADLSGWETAGGWVLAFSAGFAWYTASAMLLEGVYGRVILPLGMERRHVQVAPGRHAPVEPIEFALGEPGVRQGQ
jgi:succinate-acetate transporter protein